MQHLLVAGRAFGEAVAWGVVGGAAYGLLLGLVVADLRSDADVVLAVFVVAAGLFGLFSGVVTGVVGAFIAGTASAFDVGASAAGRLGARVVSAVTSGVCVAGTCWWMWDNNELGSPSTGGEWLQLVVVPGVAAAVIGAWRAVPILTWRMPSAAGLSPDSGSAGAAAELSVGE